ncbi:HAMP domain-containing protein [Tardiphaga sp. vice352]|uniref:ATP-binding protein n=1 Tax=unclassified Tardiphaga TaxID=2631404 RepID=UPI001165A607|nr:MULTISPECIES: ATP-binding protein [unclassified Tardiphaga]QDM16264.1 HAMP domain-containing protein [Tardiphaga sp. vice278]QDM21288.1 HAMP domain-containing protein [Tardiphaga sp. vice154]QDM26473.1 HAMP domain-containing protein [Tardiphaga sp. vice304]QDM31539.1 HAMP domain-containing protein [Tardiphaga sp. vice352]
MKRFDILNLKRISGQIAALVVVSIVAIHVIATATFLLLRPDLNDPGFDRGTSELTALIRLVAATPLPERTAMLSRMQPTFPQFDIKAIAAGTTMTPDHDVSYPRRTLRGMFGSDTRLFTLAGEPRDRITIALPDGALLSVKIEPERRQRPFWSGPLLATLLFIIISLTLLGLWAARALAAPLSSFAQAAEDFSLDGAAEPLPERGPEEIRSVARALNRMRARISTLIDDRTKMLAAISHDLRTPITRLRLRSEFIEDDGHRQHMLRDLDQMRAMLEAVLSFLRNDRKLEALTLTDIATTLQLIADQFADVGHAVSYDGPPHAMAMARPDDLHRAVTNLVENAIKFGAEARISLAISPTCATIEVADDGPGITDAQKNAMLQPFVRGDNARNMDHEASGFGLGLSIARAIVVAHGGEITLHDRQPNGLIVRITLPVKEAKAA